MDIKIIVVGQLDKDFLKEGCNLFISRIKNYANLEIIELKERANQNLKIQIKEQSNLIMAKLQKYHDYYQILLDLKGQQLTSVEFSEKIKVIKDFNSAKLLFIIGGSDGVDDIVRQYVEFQFSFGKITIPHQLCRLVLLEQIYRCFKILNNEKYHK